MKQITPHNKLLGAVALSGLLASIGLIGGLGIQLIKQDLVAFLPLLIAMPAMNAMAGDYATITAAHLADPENYRHQMRKYVKALLVSLPISCAGVVGVSLGIAHYKGFTVDFETAKAFAIQISLVLYGVVAIIFAAIYITNKLLLKFGINVDDTLLPIANTVASLLTFGGIVLVADRLL